MSRKESVSVGSCWNKHLHVSEASDNSTPTHTLAGVGGSSHSPGGGSVLSATCLIPQNPGTQP